ncbi:MFS transporter [Pseudarthrobacter sp. N5]|uniref:MFS transporter n=1 Tax=Pseudarthrobacter sp. N5 TaxID=3418416 RepID=UPI003CF8B25D
MSSTHSTESPTVLSQLAEAAVYRKISLRLLPFLLLLYTFAYLDRVNIGFAKLHMSADIGLSEAAYGLGAGLFFLGYALFEVPSNLLLVKIGIKKTIMRILCLWGLTAAAMAFVQNETAFYVLRLLLGVFEAGFAPGIIFYLTYWYSTKRMAGAMGIYMLAGPIGSMVGGPFSAFIMESFQGVGGLAGWQWMFLIQGLPCLVLAFFVWRYLDDSPRQAKWLTQTEKDILERSIAASNTEDTAGGKQGTHSFRAVLRDPKVYAFSFAYFALISGIYAISFWLPTILKDNGVNNIVQVGWLTAIPYAVTIIAMVMIGRSSDKTRERKWHAVAPAVLAAAGLLTAAFTSSIFGVSFVGMIIATACLWGAYTVFWALPAAHLKGSAAAGGIALINSIGLLGGFISPFIIGIIKDATGSTRYGLVFIVVLVLAGAAVLFRTLSGKKLPAPTPATERIDAL